MDIFPTNLDDNFWIPYINKLSQRDKYIISLMLGPIKENLKRFNINLVTSVRPMNHRIENFLNVNEDYIIFEMKYITNANSLQPVTNIGIYLKHNLNPRNKIAADYILKHYFGSYYDWDLSDNHRIHIH